jgi:5-methylcytosine-specific restriction protein A
MIARWCPRCEKPETGPCPQVRRASDANRPTAARRGYDATWRRYRTAFLNAHPICGDCETREQRIRLATEVHHLRKLADGGERLTPENTIGLCKSCHSKRTARGE